MNGFGEKLLYLFSFVCLIKQTDIFCACQSFDDFVHESFVRIFNPSDVSYAIDGDELIFRDSSDLHDGECEDITGSCEAFPGNVVA